MTNAAKECSGLNMSASSVIETLFINLDTSEKLRLLKRLGPERRGLE